MDPSNLPSPKHQLPTMEDISISTEGIQKLLLQLNPSKAAGPDAIPPSVLTELAQEVAPILQIIFQHSLYSGTLPTNWLSANIGPVLKKEKDTKLATTDQLVLHVSALSYWNIS